jgi:hypothetical protein
MPCGPRRDPHPGDGRQGDGFSEVIPSAAKRASARRSAELGKAFIEQPAATEKILRHLALWPALSWSKGPAPAHRPPAGYPLPYFLQRVAIATESVSDPSRATRAQIAGPDGAVRLGTSLRRSAFAPLVST